MLKKAFHVCKYEFNSINMAAAIFIRSFTTHEATIPFKHHVNDFSSLQFWINLFNTFGELTTFRAAEK